MIGAFLCRRGLHRLSRALVIQQPEYRLVGRICLRDDCDERRVVRQDVWSAPERFERVWADEMRELARTRESGGAA